MRRHFMAAVLLVTSAAAVTAQQRSLREQARDQDVTLVIHNEYSPATFETIASEADTIVIGVVGFGRTFLGDNDRQLVTDYQISIKQVLKRAQSPGLVDGGKLTVRRWGGAMSMEGHNVVAEENDFAAFDISGTYVLFLQSVPGESFYYVAYGPQGAFRITDDMVTQVSTKFGNWNRERGPMTTTAFVGEIRRAMRVSR
jgi:hypothetical protein